MYRTLEERAKMYREIQKGKKGKKRLPTTGQRMRFVLSNKGPRKYNTVKPWMKKKEKKVERAQVVMNWWIQLPDVFYVDKL